MCQCNLEIVDYQSLLPSSYLRSAVSELKLTLTRVTRVSILLRDCAHISMTCSYRVVHTDSALHSQYSLLCASKPCLNLCRMVSLDLEILLNTLVSTNFKFFVPYFIITDITTALTLFYFH